MAGGSARARVVGHERGGGEEKDAERRQVPGGAREDPGATGRSAVGSRHAHADQALAEPLPAVGACAISGGRLRDGASQCSDAGSPRTTWP